MTPDSDSIHSKRDIVKQEHGQTVRERHDNKGDAEIEIVPVGHPYKQHDAVFGEIDGDHGPNYRNVSHQREAANFRLAGWARVSS